MFLYMRESAYEGQRRASDPWNWSSPALSRTSFLSRKGKQEDLGEILHWFLVCPCEVVKHHVQKSLSDLKFQRDKSLSGGAAWQPATGVVEGTGSTENEQEVGQDDIFSKPIPVAYLLQQGHTL